MHVVVDGVGERGFQCLSHARHLQNRMLSCRCRIPLGMCMHGCCSIWGVWEGFSDAFRMQGICRIECICILLGTCTHECGSRWCC